MFTRPVISILLIISAAQAFSLANVQTDNKEPTCLEKIAWYRDLANTTKTLYDEYRIKLADVKLSPDALNKLNAENAEFQSTVVSMLQNYDTDSKQLGSISNSTIKRILCFGVVDNYKKMNTNLTVSASALKTNVLKAVDHSGVPKDAKDNLNKTLSTIVNLLFITDLNRNLFKDLGSLVKQVKELTELGVSLETQFKVQANGEVLLTKDIVADYDEKLLDDNESDKELLDNLKKLADDTDIKAAEMNNQNIDYETMSVYMGVGMASLALVLALLVGSVLVWIRSKRSYSQFS